MPMINDSIYYSKTFLKMSDQTQKMYSIMGNVSDTCGLIEPTQLMIIFNFEDSNLEELVENGLIIKVSDDIYAITDFYLSNSKIQKKYMKTNYEKELKRLNIIDKRYELKKENDDGKSCAYKIIKNKMTDDNANDEVENPQVKLTILFLISGLLK